MNPTRDALYLGAAGLIALWSAWDVVALVCLGLAVLAMRASIEGGE